MRRLLTGAAVLFAVAAVTLAPSHAAAQQSPAGVTPTMIEEGRQLYSSAGLCFACHGPTAEGMPGVGPNLVDGEWIHVDGTVVTIAELVEKGISVQESKSGVIMPPKGGSQLTTEQIRAVAAYVWSLGRNAVPRQQANGGGSTVGRRSEHGGPG